MDSTPNTDEKQGRFWFKMHVEWTRTPELTSCSDAAQVLWLRLAPYLDASPKPGYLLSKRGEPLSTEKIAKWFNYKPATVKHLLNELQENEVLDYCSLPGRKGIATYCFREMAAAHALSEKRRKAGKAGMASRYDDQDASKPF